MDHYNERRSIMKLNILEVKGKATVGALALALSALPSFAAEPDAQAFVRDSIRNTWTSTAVASPTEGKMDAHERARVTLVGVAKSPTASGMTGADVGSRIGAHEQARRLLLAQPVATERVRSGS
jgi:hypothetical protein